MISKRKIKKWILGKTWQRYITHKISRDTIFKIDDIKINVSEGVFHPQYFYSTKYFIDFIKSIDISQHHFLELGCGSGLISVFAYNRGAIVTAIDISKKAVENTISNVRNNDAKATVIVSDLFDELTDKKYDTIFINPPYFKKQPVAEKDYAWYCGNELQYFHKLFSQLKNHLSQDGNAFMILSDECDISGIKNICIKHHFSWQQEKVYMNWLEKNFIFKIKAV